jgi:hypothetical protein
MFGWVRPVAAGTRRVLAIGLAFTATSAGSASAENVRHGLGIGVAMLMTTVLVAAIVQYGERPTSSGAAPRCR